MSEKNDGGPAFPTKPYYGMSLRDYFAAHAIAAASKMWDEQKHVVGDRLTLQEIAYEIADAMLVAREK